jgi:hypothetical protein
MALQSRKSAQPAAAATGRKMMMVIFELVRKR